MSHLDLSAFRVFEYGSGNSTLWWSDRVNQITSVEDDEYWYQKIKILLKSRKNATYLLEKNRLNYSSMASNGFDIFIVDGRYRRECLEHIVKLDEAVMVILDNSDWYPNSVRFLQDKLGYIKIDFHGLDQSIAIHVRHQSS